MQEAFKALLRESIPACEVDPLCEALFQTQAAVSIRLHPRKKALLSFPCDQTVPWCPQGRYVDQRPVFGTDPLFHAGTYYVQEAASMALWQLRDILPQTTDRLRVLDACASPGGKTTLLLDVLPTDSLLVSNEVIVSRIPALTQNVAKWGYGHCVVTQNDPADFERLPSFFDMVVADAPCSGEGMFRKDPAARNEWSLEHVALCATRQRRIIAHLWTALRPGGLFVYSTCTFNHLEDEDQVDWMCRTLHAQPVRPPEKRMPHQFRGEGFFWVVMQKPLEAEGPAPMKMRTPKAAPLPPHAPHPLCGAYTYFMQDTLLKALPTPVYADALHVARHMNVQHSGIAVATYKAPYWIPHADVALAVDTDPTAWPRVDLSPEQAQAYLRRNSITLPADTPKDYILVTYQDVPLGFVKNVGNRCNNLYPPTRRIYSK